jgi:hypothetical protein
MMCLFALIRFIANLSGFLGANRLTSSNVVNMIAFLQLTCTTSTVTKLFMNVGSTDDNI